MARPTVVQLRAARDAGRAAGLAGAPVRDCPYPPDRALERHVWLRWYSHQGLVAAGFPHPDQAGERVGVDAADLRVTRPSR